MFDLRDVYSYPTTLALLPNSLLQGEIAENLFRHVDHQLSQEKKLFYGHYVLVVAKKPNLSPINGYDNVIKLLKAAGVDPKSVEL